MKFPGNVCHQTPSASFASSGPRPVVPANRWLVLGAALLVAIGSGCNKPAPVAPATPTPAPTPVATPILTPTPVAATPVPTATPEAQKYTGAQQAEYIKTAQDAFVEARMTKSTPYMEANKAFLDAGGATAKGLTSKESIAQRREMIAKVSQANEDYLTFASAQDNAYREELSKTPLVKADVESLVTEFIDKGKQKDIVKLRESVRDLLKTADSMMVYLDKKYGGWTFTNGRISFKKPADAGGYSDLIKKYSAAAGEIQKLQESVNAPMPTPGLSPAATPAATTSVPAATGVAPVASPAP